MECRSLETTAEGYALVSWVAESERGGAARIAYVILDPSGNEVARFHEIDQAAKAFEWLSTSNPRAQPG
jgi:hypothetical protein